MRSLPATQNFNNGLKCNRNRLFGQARFALGFRAFNALDDTKQPLYAKPPFFLASMLSRTQAVLIPALARFGKRRRVDVGLQFLGGFDSAYRSSSNLSETHDIRKGARCSRKGRSFM